MLRQGRPLLWANRKSSLIIVAGCFDFRIWIIVRRVREIKAIIDGLGEDAKRILLAAARIK